MEVRVQRRQLDSIVAIDPLRLDATPDISKSSKNIIVKYSGRKK